MNKNDCCFKIAGPTQAVIGPWTGGLKGQGDAWPARTGFL